MHPSLLLLLLALLLVGQLLAPLLLPIPQPLLLELAQLPPRPVPAAGVGKKQHSVPPVQLLPAQTQGVAAAVLGRPVPEHTPPWNAPAGWAGGLLHTGGLGSSACQLSLQHSTL
jgi:hypothetical protein